MTSTRQSPFSFAEEAIVVDASGEELGTVAEVREGYFKVDVSMASDYWLPFHTISRTEGAERVYLNCTGDELEKAKVGTEIESLTSTELEEGLAPTGNPAPMERRYENEADYLLHPHQPT